MTDDVSSQPANPADSNYRLPEPLHRVLNADGLRHPVENTLAFLAVGLGLGSVVLLLLTWYDASAWAGLAGGFVAAYDEFIAKTSAERWLILLGFALCLVSLALSMAQGALF